MYKELNEKRHTTSRSGNKTNNQQQADVTTSRFGPFYDKVHMDPSAASDVLLGNGDGWSGEYPWRRICALSTTSQADYFAGKEVRHVQSGLT